jgi:hypothetical protein
MSSCNSLNGTFTVESDNCKYTDDAILSDYRYVVVVRTLCFGAGLAFLGHSLQVRVRRRQPPIPKDFLPPPSVFVVILRPTHADIKAQSWKGM